jgi:hypothetical protein
MTFSGYLEDYIGVRFTVVTGCAIMTTGVLLTSLSIQVGPGARGQFLKKPIHPNFARRREFAPTQQWRPVHFDA